MLRDSSQYRSREIISLTKRCYLLRPNVVHFLRQSGDEQQQVRDGQTEQVVVGGGVHVFVARDHYTGADVANDSAHKYGAVAHGYGYHYQQRVSLGAPQTSRAVLVVSETMCRLFCMYRL